LEPGFDDWGLSPSQQESYVEQFRRILAAKNAWFEDQHDYFVLRRFLRARSYDLEKATTMWMNNLAWKAEFKVDTILQDFYFEERDKFLTCYPQGYHKVDKLGRPIYVQLLGQVNVEEMKRVTTEERMIKFHIQEYERCVKVILPICSRLAGRNIDSTFGIMDVKGVGLGHLTGEVKRLMTIITKYDQDNYPEMLGRICIINAPTVFRWVWAVVKNMIDPRTQSKIEILGTDYVPGLLKHVDVESLPDWLGGKSKGSLIDDVGPWSDPPLVASLGLDMEELRRGRRPPPPAHMRDPTLLTSIGSGRRSFQQGGGSLIHPGSGGSSVAAGHGHGSGAHAEFGRTSDLLPIASMGHAEGWASPLHSSGDFSNTSLRQPRFSSGVSADMLDDAARRHGLAATDHSAVGVTLNGSQPANAAFYPTTIPEGPGGAEAGRPRTLAERVAALERSLPPHLARLNGAQAATLRAAGGAGTGAASTKSAPEGSLLYRVEVLEEAVDMLVAAQQAALEYQQQLAVRQEQAEVEAAQKQKPRECCCCVM